MRAFLWKATHESLMTNCERLRGHLVSSATCAICGLEEESLFHFFRDCQKVATIWWQLSIPRNSSFFSESNWYNLDVGESW